MRLLIFTIFLFFNIFVAKSQDYALYPINKSDKWHNGSEWSFDSKNGIEVKVLFSDFKSNKLIFTVVVKNNTQSDFNIDPDQIYYLSNEFNIDKIVRSKPINPSNTRRVLVTDQDYINEITKNKDTVFVEKPDKLIKNLKKMAILGFLFDSDNMALNRGYAKMDYYKENLLLKHTIEPSITHSKILVIDGYDYIEKLILVIKLEGEEFLFPFQSSEILN